MFDLKDFIRSPSGEKLEGITKIDWIVLARYYNVEVSESARKQEISNKVSEALMTLEILSDKEALLLMNWEKEEADSQQSASDNNTEDSTSEEEGAKAKVAEQREWPRTSWSTLVQTSFRGKAREVFAALSLDDSKDYERVKSEVLKAYEWVPERYREKFRSWIKRDGHTHMEYAREQRLWYDRWINAREVNGDFGKLQELILLEQFKDGINPLIKTYMDERDVIICGKPGHISRSCPHRTENRPIQVVNKVKDKPVHSKKDDHESDNTIALLNQPQSCGDISPCLFASPLRPEVECTFPNIFPACAVTTRSKSTEGKVKDDDCLDLQNLFKDSPETQVSKVSTPLRMLKVNKEEFVKSQIEDENLKVIRDNALVDIKDIEKEGKAQHDPKVMPLQPIEVPGEPFERLVLDCVGPLPRSSKGNEYLLTIMCSATRFPEAIPLRTVSADKIIEALNKFFSLVGLPKEVQTDQGTNFTSKKFKSFLACQNIKHCLSSPYHPQSQGVVERFHRTFKTMLRTYCCENEKEWDVFIPMLLFAVRDSVHSSLGYSPFQLVYVHQVRSPMEVIKNKFISDEKDSITLQEMKKKIKKIWKVAHENLEMVQEGMKRNYDKKAAKRELDIGDKVLVYLPTSGKVFNLKYIGPCTVKEKDLEGVFVYLDDIIIVGETWEDHIKKVYDVFKRLLEFNVTINLAKCEFGKTTVQYLGHEIGSGHVRPVDCHIEVIKNLTIPTSKRGVMKFLGTVGYYRKFCKNFSDVAYPLTELLKKDVKFVWSKECDEAFSKLKLMLMSKPVLKSPDFNLPFKLQVDSSELKRVVSYHLQYCPTIKHVSFFQEIVMSIYDIQLGSDMS
ncbi:uncharacterized protein [Palaemon carinicauda]|uniref:uncharacterized protein n=1 Tax=Palaemon carinicauda TaxID=392227 RepID=UPI0035B5F718